MVSNIRKKSLTQQVADVIREEIMGGAYHQGQQLKQSEVASRYGVSQIPVREAFQLLEAEGLVENVPYKGAIVSMLQESEIAEYFDIRATLEAELLEKAVPRLTADHIARAREAYEASLVATPDKWGECNWMIHDALYEAAGRPITLEMVKKIHDNLDRYVRMQLSLSEHNLKRANNDHKGLIDLCEKRDGEAALVLLGRHIRQARQDLIDYLAGAS